MKWLVALSSSDDLPVDIPEVSSSRTSYTCVYTFGITLRIKKQDGPIHRWLASVEGGLQTHHVDEKQGRDTSPALAAKIPHILLEDSDILKRPEHPSPRKKKADQLDTVNAPRPAKAALQIENLPMPQQNYELKSRHKAREDRYEYKGPSSVIGSQSQVSKSMNRKSRGRRHTMNDDFHAINVTANRLTLRNNQSLGIFSKGKTSSTSHPPKSPPISHLNAESSNKPHKQRSGSDLAFSEMKFLSNISSQKKSIGVDSTHTTFFEERKDDDDTLPSRRKQTVPKNSKVDVGQAKMPAAVGQREGSSSPLPSFREVRLHSHHRSTNGICGSNESPSDIQLGGSRLPLPASKDLTPSLHDPSPTNMLVSIIQRGESRPSPPPKRPRPPSIDGRQKRRRLPEGSSSVPCNIWNESEDDSTEKEQALEQELLALMHVGLCPEGISSEFSRFNFAGRIWSLSELWSLLNERKILWSNEAINILQAATPKRSIPDVMTQDHSTTCDAIFSPGQEPQIAIEKDCDIHLSLSRHDSILQTRKSCQARGPDKEEVFEPSTKSPKICGRVVASMDGVNESQWRPLTQKSADSQFLPSPSALGLSRPSLYEVDVHGLSRVEDDDLFYQTLDDAYHAIVHPEVTAGVASNLQRLLTSPENSNPFGQHRLRQTTPLSGSSNPHPRKLALEPNLSEPHIGNITQEKGREQPCEVSHPRERENVYAPSNNMPWLAGYQPQLDNSTVDHRGQSQPPGPFGFWRQNKLY